MREVRNVPVGRFQLVSFHTQLYLPRPSCVRSSGATVLSHLASTVKEVRDQIRLLRVEQPPRAQLFSPGLGRWKSAPD